MRLQPHKTNGRGGHAHAELQFSFVLLFLNRLRVWSKRSVLRYFEIPLSNFPLFKIYLSPASISFRFSFKLSAQSELFRRNLLGV